MMGGLLSWFVETLVRLATDNGRPPPMLVDRGEDTPSVILANMVAAEILSFQGEIEWRKEEPSLSEKQRAYSDRDIAEFYKAANRAGIMHDNWPQLPGQARTREFFTLKTAKITLTGERHYDGYKGQVYHTFDYYKIVPGVSFTGKEEAIIKAAFDKALEFEQKRKAIAREGIRQEKATEAMEKWLGIGKFGTPSLEDMSLKSN